MSDSEYEEEEFLVYADFKNQLLPQEISDPNAAIKIIGIESKNPIAEINGNIFKGTYEFAMGTNVFFEKDTVADNYADALYEKSCKQKYKYFGKTNKQINFQRIYVERKVAESAKVDRAEATPDPAAEGKEENLKISATYEEVIRQFPAMRDSPLAKKDDLS